MFGRDTYTPKPETLFELRPLRTTSIDEVLNWTEIPQLVTEEPNKETYWFWKNPENLITTEDRAALYWQWEGEDFTHSEPEKEIGHGWYVG